MKPSGLGTVPSPRPALPMGLVLPRTLRHGAPFDPRSVRLRQPSLVCVSDLMWRRRGEAVPPTAGPPSCCPGQQPQPLPAGGCLTPRWGRGTPEHAALRAPAPGAPAGRAPRVGSVKTVAVLWVRPSARFQDERRSGDRSPLQPAVLTALGLPGTAACRVTGRGHHLRAPVHAWTWTPAHAHAHAHVTRRERRASQEASGGGGSSPGSTTEGVCPAGRA